MPLPSSPISVPDSGVTVSVSQRGNQVELEIFDPLGEQPSPRLLDDTVAMVSRLLREARADDLQTSLAAEHPADSLLGLPEAVADRTGHSNRRDLLQLRRPLPVEANHAARTDTAVATRAFAPGTSDEANWVAVNNRAFAEHRDQGHETVESLAQAQTQPWFDAAGFLVADDLDRPDAFRGFCWTKVHPGSDTDQPMGEIYVIGVDPSHRGEGLGAALVLAGLDHLHEQGLTMSVLYVDSTNTAACALYDRLGFSVARRRRVYTP